MEVALVHGCMVAGIGALPYIVPALHADLESLVYPLCVLLTLLCLWCLCSWSAVGRSLFCPYTIFLGAAILFNAGQGLLETVNFNDGGLLSGRFSPSIRVQTLYLVVLGLASLHLGALVGAGSGPRQNRPPGSRLAPDRLTDSAMIRTGLTLLAVSSIPMLMQLRRAVGVVMRSGYLSLYQQEASTGYAAAWQVVATLFVPGALFLLIGGRNVRHLRWTGAGLIGIYSLLTFFLGSRGWAVMPLLATAWAWDRMVYRLPRWMMVSGALLLLVVFPIVGAVRSVSGADRLSPRAWAEAARPEDNLLVRAVREMGTSMQTISHTLELVPAVRPFDEGRSYLGGLSSIFPNLFWEVHPAVQYAGLGHWLTATVDPIQHKRGGSLGFSFLAEAYLNFGWWGIPVVMAGVGLVFGRLSHWGALPGDAAKVAAMAVFLSFALYWPRGESLFVFRPIVWLAVPAYLLTMYHRAALARAGGAENRRGMRREPRMTSIGTTG